MGTIIRREERKSIIKSCLKRRTSISAVFMIWSFNCSLKAITRSSVSLDKVSNSLVVDVDLETFNSNFRQAEVGILSALFLFFYLKLFVTNVKLKLHISGTCLIKYWS